MPENSKPAELQFPIGGIDLTGEFSEQPPDTTPVAINVRGVNPDSLRERGGSRAGLKKYIPGPLFAGADLIQHLNVIVDPQGPLLGQAFETPGPDWIEDPLNPGFFVPPGGWGWQFNPNALPPDDGTVRLLHAVGSVAFANALPGNTMTLTFPAVAVDQLNVVIVATIQGDPDGTDGDQHVVLAVKNGAATAFTQAGTYVIVDNSGTSAGPSYCRMSLWYRVLTSATDDATITIKPTPAVMPSNPDGAVLMYATALNYRNTATSSPLQDFAKASSEPAASSLTVGPITLPTNGVMIGTIANGVTPTPAPTMTQAFNESSTLYTFNKYPVSGGSSIVFSLGASNPLLMAIAASFKKKP